MDCLSPRPGDTGPVRPLTILLGDLLAAISRYGGLPAPVDVHAPESWQDGVYVYLESEVDGAARP